MKAYGLPREPGVEFPDIGDIQYYGLNTGTGRKHNSKNSKKSYTRSAENRTKVRRQFKKRERRNIKSYINQGIYDE